MKVIYFVFPFLVSSQVFATSPLKPEQSRCLEDAATQAISALDSKGDFHVIRNQKNQVTAIVNLDTEESYSLAYIDRQPSANEEFISFENSENLLNLSARILPNGKCKLQSVNFYKNDGEN